MTDEKSQILKLIDPLRTAPLECDGMTRVILFVLRQAGINCTAMFGRITGNERTIEPHCWVKLESSGMFVDLRARMWLGQHDWVPNGVFDQKEYPRVRYVGMPVDWEVNELLFNLLML